LQLLLLGGTLLAGWGARPAQAVTLNPLWEREYWEVNGVAFSPDGETLAVHSFLLEGECEPKADGTRRTPDGTPCPSSFPVELLNLRTGARIRWFGGGDFRDDPLMFTPDGQTLVSLSFSWSSYGARSWQVSDGVRIRSVSMGTTSRHRETFLSADLQYAVACTYMPAGPPDGYQQIKVWRTMGEAPPGPGAVPAVWSISTSPAPGLEPSVFLVRDPGLLGVWTRTGVQLRRFDDGTLARELTPEEWDREKEQLLPPAPPQPPRGRFIAKSGDGKIMASLAERPDPHNSRSLLPDEVLFWRDGRGEPAGSFKASSMGEPRFSPDFKYLVYSLRPEEWNPSRRGTRFVVALNPYANRGDLDLDGETSVTDAVAALRFVVGLAAPEDDERYRADMNGNDELTVSDVVHLLMNALGLPGGAP
jgi:hypothetical protein